MQKGIVIKSTGSWYLIKDIVSNEVIESRIVGKFRMNNKYLTNPVAVGDEVEYIIEQEGKGMIKKILPRRNYVVRQSPRQRQNLHLLASNVDQAIIITTIIDPELKLGFVDRFLLMTEAYSIPTVLIFNKSDLYEAAEMEYFEVLKNTYESIGYTVMLVSAEDKIGLDDFISLLKDKTSLVAGQSGVGKSTLVNSIQPQLDLRTGEISDYSGKGQHTTTFAEMHPLTFGGSIIDTPGIKLLAFTHLKPDDISHNFKEIFQASKTCRYGDCSHRSEPNCAVKTAVADGSIADWRYASFLQLLEETEDQNYWERHKDA
jgi:ribosome biogenesis GTPase / thiamine phosphate phosphatase